MLENSLQPGRDLVFASLLYKIMRNLMFSWGELVLYIFYFGLGFSFGLDKESRAATTICLLASVTMSLASGTVRRRGRRHSCRTDGMVVGGAAERRKTE